MKNEFIIKIYDNVNSSSIFGRSAGNKIKQEINKYYTIGIKVVIDFNNIKSVTHSFMDELIGAYFYYDAEKALEKIKFINCNNDIKNMIKFVVKDRIMNSKESHK